MFGACLVVLGIIERIKLKASQSWPKTTGVITESSVKPEWVKAGNGWMHVESPKVIYEYQVEGRKYHSSQLALEEVDTANENLAREKSEKYPVGREVDVYYDPKKPDFATLQVGDPSHGKLPFGIVTAGAILMAAGIVWLIWLYK